jgi:hypothetical protein
LRKYRREQRNRYENDSGNRCAATAPREPVPIREASILACGLASRRIRI